MPFGQHLHSSRAGGADEAKIAAGALPPGWSVNGHAAISRCSRNPGAAAVASAQVVTALGPAFGSCHGRHGDLQSRSGTGSAAARP